MPDLSFRSEDGRFRLEIAEAQVADLFRLCIESGAVETGGILVGRYTDDLGTARVTAVSGPPSDSQRGRARFVRGVHGIQKWLNRLWQRQREYYLGEWHYHPDAQPHPSHRDVSQMKDIAASPHYRCPEPVLLLVGGSPPEHLEMLPFVVPKGEEPTALAAMKGEGPDV